MSSVIFFSSFNFSSSPGSNGWCAFNKSTLDLLYFPWWSKKSGGFTFWFQQKKLCEDRKLRCYLTFYLESSWLPWLQIFPFCGVLMWVTGGVAPPAPFSSTVCVLIASWTLTTLWKGCPLSGSDTMMNGDRASTEQAFTAEFVSVAFMAVMEVFFFFFIEVLWGEEEELRFVSSSGEKCLRRSQQLPPQTEMVNERGCDSNSHLWSSVFQIKEMKTNMIRFSNWGVIWLWLFLADTIQSMNRCAPSMWQNWNVLRQVMQTTSTFSYRCLFHPLSCSFCFCSFRY